VVGALAVVGGLFGAAALLLQDFFGFAHTLLGLGGGFGGLGAALGHRDALRGRVGACFVGLGKAQRVFGVGHHLGSQLGVIVVAV